MNKKELLEAKRAAEEDLSGAKKELREIAEGGGDLPEELKTRATKAADEIVRLDKEIEGEDKRAKERAQEQVERLQEFEATLNRNQPPTRHTQDSDRHPDPAQREAGTKVVTREYIGDMAPQLRDLFEDFGYNRRATEAEQAFSKGLFEADDSAQGMEVRRRINLRPLSSLYKERANFEIQVDAQGGLGMPDDQRFFGILESRRVMFMGVEKVSNVIYTDTDDTMPYHLVDTTGNEGIPLVRLAHPETTTTS